MPDDLHFHIFMDHHAVDEHTERVDGLSVGAVVEFVQSAGKVFNIRADGRPATACRPARVPANFMTGIRAAYSLGSGITGRRTTASPFLATPSFRKRMPASSSTI